MEGKKRTLKSQYVNGKEGRLLRDNGLIQELWVRELHKLICTKPPIPGLTIVYEIKACSPCRSLDNVSSRYEVAEAIRAMANPKVVGPGGVSAEILKFLADEGDSDTQGMVYEILAAVWRGGDE